MKRSRAAEDLAALCRGGIAWCRAAKELLESPEFRERAGEGGIKILRMYTPAESAFEDTLLDLERGTLPRPAGQMRSGFLQGLRDLGNAREWLPEEDYKSMREALLHGGGPRVAELLRADASRLAKIVSRGRIRTESEFYLARDRVDEIEGLAEHEEECRSWHRLLGEFETRRR